MYRFYEDDILKNISETPKIGDFGENFCGDAWKQGWKGCYYSLKEKIKDTKSKEIYTLKTHEELEPDNSSPHVLKAKQMSFKSFRPDVTFAYKFYKS